MKSPIESLLSMKVTTKPGPDQILVQIHSYLSTATTKLDPTSKQLKLLKPGPDQIPVDPSSNCLNLDPTSKQFKLLQPGPDQIPLNLKFKLL